MAWLPWPVYHGARGVAAVEEDLPHCACRFDRLFECDCYRLVDELRNNAQLPGHLNVDVMRRACEQWIWDTAQVSLSHSFPNGTRPLIPIPNSAPLDLQSPAHGVPFRWPFSIQMFGVYLLMVIREWVEERPNAKLGAELSGDESWAEIIKLASISDPDRFEPVQNWSMLRDLLRYKAFPATPGTIRYLFKSTFPDKAKFETEGPTRGALVSTFVMFDISDGVTRLHSQIAASPQWTTKQITERAHRITEGHMEWWNNIVRTRSLVVPDHYDSAWRELNAIRAGDVSNEAPDWAARIPEYLATEILFSLEEARRPNLLKFNGRPTDEFNEWITRLNRGEVEYEAVFQLMAESEQRERKQRGEAPLSSKELDKIIRKRIADRQDNLKRRI